MKTHTLELHCPDVHLQVDAIMIEQTLSSSPGIDTVRVDWSSGDVFVTTANQDGGEDVIRRLDKAGFPVEKGKPFDLSCISKPDAKALESIDGA